MSPPAPRPALPSEAEAVVAFDVAGPARIMLLQLLLLPIAAADDDVPEWCRYADNGDAHSGGNRSKEC